MNLWLTIDAQIISSVTDFDIVHQLGSVKEKLDHLKVLNIITTKQTINKNAIHYILTPTISVMDYVTALKLVPV